MVSGVINMAGNVTEFRSKPSDSEKVTINLGYVDLGLIDLLVAEKFYSNRTDFIRTAIRNQLERHSEATKQSTSRKSLELGLRLLTRRELEEVRGRGEKLHLRVLGLVTIADDVTPELALATIESIDVLGALHANPAVKAALTDRRA
jgi:Arc/MetJ-type ribon-helix-helix transcriptional regulator